MASTKQDYSGYIFPLALAFIAYKAYDALFGKEERDEKPGGDVDPGAGDTRPATLDEATAEVICTAIKVAIWGPGDWQMDPWEDEDMVVNSMTMPQLATTADVRVLENVYGERGPLTLKFNLPTTIAKYLDDDDRQRINDVYAQRNITIRF